MLCAKSKLLTHLFSNLRRLRIPIYYCDEADSSGPCMHTIYMFKNVIGDGGADQNKNKLYARSSFGV